MGKLLIFPMLRKYTSLPYTEYPVAEGNFDRTRAKIEMVIIHSTVSTAQSAIAWFNNPKAKASAHYIVGNDGRLYAMLEEYYTAYHAGNYQVNLKSVAIECEWYQGLTPSDKLYETASKLVADICKYYQIPCNRGTVKGHNEIIPTACPNAISVDRIVKQAQEILSSSQKPTYQELEQKVKDLQATEERLKKEKEQVVVQYEERIRALQTEKDKQLAEQRVKLLNEFKQKVISLANSLT